MSGANIAMYRIAGVAIFSLFLFGCGGGGGGGGTAAAPPAAAADTDSDGVDDSSDNCILVFNPAQRDTNGDGHGNFCDPDLDNDCIVTVGAECANGFPSPECEASGTDAAAMIPVFFLAGDFDEDLNGDNIVNFLDLDILFDFDGLPPGPSAMGLCAP